MTHKRKIVNKWQFIMNIFQMICLIGLCSSLEGDGNNVETTRLEGSSEKKVFNFETEIQSPAGSPNLKEMEKKKLLGIHADDEYIVQENESEDDNREPEDDGYIVQDDESPSNEDFPHNLEFKKAPKSSNVDTPHEDQVQKTKHDDVIPTGRKDVYHYGNASPQKQEKQFQEGTPNNGGQKTKMSTWEKAQLTMMKRNKIKLEKTSKQTEASKKDKIDSGLKATEESLNIEEPDNLRSNIATSGIHDNFVTNDATNSPSLIDDDGKRVDEDQSEDSVPMADVKKDVDNDKVKNSDDDKYDDDDDESVTNDINDESIEEIKIITHNVTDEAMEHIYPDDDDDVKEGGMDHVYPDDDEEEEDNTENESDEDDDYSNQYDDDDAIVDDSEDVEGATMSDNISSVDKSQTDSSDDVTIDAAVGLIDGIDKNQPNDIGVPAEDDNEEPDTVNEGVIDKMTRDDVDANMKDDDEGVKRDDTTADVEQEVKEDDNSVIGAEVQGINVTNEMVIVDSSGKEAIKNDSIVDNGHNAVVDSIENVTVVNGIGNDIAVDDIKKTPDINKYMDNDVDKIERHLSEQINEGERATITVENDSKNISFDSENDVNNFTYIINAGQIDARVIPPTEIIENDGIDADKSAIERFFNHTKKNVTEESTLGHDDNVEDSVSEIVESIKNKSVDTKVINNKTVYVIGETNVEATLPDVEDQSEMTGTQQELKNDNDVEEELDNDEISEDNIVEDITVNDGDNNDETIDKSVNPEVSKNDNIVDDDEGETNITDKVNELPVAKDDDNVTRYITSEIDHVVDDEHEGDDNKESVDVISPPNVTFEDAPTYVEPTDDDETKDQDDIKEATTEKIVNYDDDIGGDDVGEEENKTETNITDVEIDDEQIFINNSLSDHTILATDSNTDSGHKLDIEQFEVSKMEEPIDETKDVDNNSSQDGEDGKDSIDSLKDTNVERDVLNFAEESSKSLEEESDIKLDVTSQVDENSDADTDGSVHMKPDGVESGEDKEKSNANENKPEDRINSGEDEADELESTIDTDQSYEKKEESSTEKKEEALNEKMFNSKDFSIPFEGHGGHPQTMHEDIGKKDESIDDLARELTHHDEEVQTEGDDKDATIKGHADKVEGEAKEGENTPDSRLIKENDDTALEGITRDDKKLSDDELEQIFHDATPKTASSFWKFITIKPYVALLRTLTDKLDPHITNIIFMLPPSVQSIFLKAPFGMYPTHAFLLLLFSFISLFVLQTSRKSQIDSQNKSRILRELLFEKRGEVLLRQTEKDEADKRLKEAREELKQKEADFENRIANNDKNLKAIAKEHNYLKDEILKKIEKRNEMEEDSKKIESDIVKQSRENKELQESVSSTKELIQKLQDMRDELQHSIDESDLRCLKLEESIECLNNDVCTIKESYDQLSTVMEAKNKESGELQDVVGALNVKCTKQSIDLQRKEQANKALRNAILKLKMMRLLLKANGCQATDDDAHNDGAADDDDNGDDDDDDQKKQEKIDEKIKHLVYIAQMKRRMDEVEKERMSLRKDLSKEIDVRMKLNDDLERTAEEMKKYEQLKEDAEQRASNLNIRIEVQEKYLKEKEKELNRILMEMKAKENAKSKQKKSAEEKYKEVEKMVAENRKLVEQWEAEKEKMAIDYEKQIAQQERKVQEYVAFANRAKRDFEEKEKLSKTLREKLLLYQDIINKSESMQRSSESLNASQNLEDVRSSSRNLLTRDNAHPSMSPIPPPPIPPPHIASEFFNRFAPPPLIPSSLLFSERSMPPPFLMRPRESSPISDNFRDVLPSDDRYRFHPMRSTPPMRFGPTYRSPPPANRERYPNANNRPQYMGKGDGSHRTLKD